MAEGETAVGGVERNYVVRRWWSVARIPPDASTLDVAYRPQPFTWGVVDSLVTVLFLASPVGWTGR